MRFDDRLSTVLRKPATNGVIARIQYRQLLDLLGTSPSEVNGPQIDAAYLRLHELSGMVPEAERAAVLGEPMARLRSPIDSRTARNDDQVDATLTGAVTQDGVELIPAGSIIHGRILQADAATRKSPLGRFEIAFTYVYRTPQFAGQHKHDGYGSLAAKVKF